MGQNFSGDLYPTRVPFMSADYGSELVNFSQDNSMLSHTDENEPEERSSRLLLFVLMGFCLLFIISYTSRLVEYSRSQALLSHWDERIEQAKERQADLVAQREFVYSDDYVDRIAREDLGLAKPGDNVIVVIPDAENTSGLTEAEISTTDQPQDLIQMPIWQQWLELFRQNSRTGLSLQG